MIRRIRAAHLAYVVRPTFLHRLLGPPLERLSERDWRNTGEGPAPASVKHRLIRDYASAYHFRNFVETGTFLGDMIEAVRDDFEELHSIELDIKLHRKAVERFAGVPNVRLHLGDSGLVLPDLVHALGKPTLFWLDAHWSRGVTARGELDTPISAELDAVMRDETMQHILLIDDARLFGVAKDYPAVEEIRHAVTKRRPDWSVLVSEDVIHVGPSAMLLIRESLAERRGNP